MNPKHVLIWILLFCLACPIYSQTLNEDELLLELVNQQARQLQHRDSVNLQGASLLYLPLYFEPYAIRGLMDTTEHFPSSKYAIRQQARRYITTHCANLYVGISNSGKLVDVEIEGIEIPRAIITDIEEEKLELARALKNQYSPWRKELNLSLQLTQNYATDNWYQGAANTFALLWSMKGLLNYKKDPITWENIMEWRAGFSTSNNDSIHKVRTTDDIFRLYSKVGVQFHPQVYGTLFSEFKTNLFPNWKTNQRMLAATFLTPLRFTIGLGAEYKPIKNLSINIAPATYKMVFALDSNATHIDITEFGIPQDANIVNEMGSSVRLMWKWTPLREIQLDTEFYFYTNYHRIETELEVTCNFIINRYMSAKIMLHPRYDSSSEVKPGRISKIQFKEFISVGFAHKFH